MLQEEFANQGKMEKEVGLETTLFGGPPELGNTYKLAMGQIGFMSIFALPLFEGVSDLLPQMTFTVEQIRTNQRIWQKLADGEQTKQARRLDSGPSPRSYSPVASRKTADPAPKGRGGGSGSTDSPDISSIEHDDAASEAVANGGIYDSPRSSLGSVSRPAYNENTSDSTVSPDNNGPSIEVTTEGPLSESEMPSRKSSSAIPADIAMIAIAEACERKGNDSTETHHVDIHATSDAAPLANYSLHTTNGADATDAGSSRPSSSRRDPRHHTDHSSSGGASCPSSCRQSCTRTHSVSTRSNTVMTPTSPATNATSFLTVDSGEEKEFPPGDGIVIREDGDHLRHDDIIPRPSSASADQYVFSSSGREHEIHHYSNPASRRASAHHHIDDMNKGAITATIIGNGQTSPAHSTTSENVESEPQTGDEGGLGGDGDQPPRRLPKRRSRLRLAFWKRKTYLPHRPEVSNGT